MIRTESKETGNGRGKNRNKIPGYAESIIDTVREPLIALDQDLRVISVSRSYYNFFKVKPEETGVPLITYPMIDCL